MKIDNSTIERIEQAFGFKLYEWQKDYLLGNRLSTVGGRVNGKTFAYCLKLLLSDGEIIKRRDLYKYAYGFRRGASYWRFFTGFVEKVNTKLVESGLETRMEV